MPKPSLISDATSTLAPVAGHAAADARGLVPRAIIRGTAVGAGGALVMSTLIGVAAVVAMANDGLSPQSIVRQMHSQWDIRLFVAMGELFMAALGGYVAATTAGRMQLRHALGAGAGTLGVNLIVVAMCGSPLPVWLAAASLALDVPCAALGGYLASPRAFHEHIRH